MTPKRGPKTPRGGEPEAVMDSKPSKAPTKSRLKSSAKLMQEEEDISLDLMTENEVADESHNDTSIAAPVEAENGETEEPPVPAKRKRGRPKKGQEVNKKVVTSPRRSGRRQELESRREEEERIQREREKQEREEAEERQRQELERAAALQKQVEEQKQKEFEARNAKLIEQGLEPLPMPGSPVKSPRKRKLPEKGSMSPTPESPSKKSRDLSSPRKTPLERRSKKGRPSKQETITKQVVSIFQMDDAEIFGDRRKESPSKSTDEKSKGAIYSDALNFDNENQSTFSKVPTISGIRRDASKKAVVDKTEATQFVPFPVPSVDEDGKPDPDYMQAHLPGIVWGEEKTYADERAFFLEGSEGYFEQHNLRLKSSTHSLASRAPALDYAEFRPMVNLGQLIHKDEKEAIRKHHSALFQQWCFELSQGYNLNFYGVGSKASLIMEFLENYFLDWYEATVQDDETIPDVMVVNGYNPSLKLKRIVQDIVSMVVTDEDRAKPGFRMPKHTSDSFPFLTSYLKRKVTLSEKNNIIKPNLVLVIHNIDGEALRDEKSQNFLSQLGSLPNVWVVVSSDNINAGLLWDLYRFKNFNFIWHDLTTYEAYTAEMSFKDVLSTGKSKKFVSIKSVKHVLVALTTGARNLYKMLLRMQIKKLEQLVVSREARVGLRANVNSGVERKPFYERCVADYILSNEHDFNGMMREFMDHKMCVLAKNTAGTEILFIPFTFDEMEKVLAEAFPQGA